MKCGLAVIAGLAVVVLASACERAQPVRPLIVRLESGDSVELVGWSRAVVPNEPEGLLLGYRPFASMEDTLGLQRIAVALWRTYARTLAEQSEVSWVVLQARSRPATGAAAPVVTNSTYGVVLDRGADGKWYFHRSGQPVD